MDEKGIIHDDLERKILILYILRRLPCEVDMSVLFELCNNIDCIDYFTFTQCCSDLNETNLCSDSDGYVAITPKGAQTVESVETGLPYSVRLKADDAVEAASDILRRFSLVKAEYSPYGEGWNVNMSLNDGAGELMNLQLLCADKEQAAKLRSNFRDNAEKYYNMIISMLSE